MARLGMVIDLHKCTGCGACAIACKTENNTDLKENGQTHNWADFQYEMKGKFPDLEYTARPVLCNHCTDAPCVEACPVKPKAMFKTKDGITMHNDERCIGCRKCQKACPYSARDVDKENADYSVISFVNRKIDPHEFYRDTEEMIAGCSTSGAELSTLTGETPPFATKYSSDEYNYVRRKKVTEKCILCAHLLKDGDDPYCVASCPAGARAIGDFDNPNSKVSKLLKEYESYVLKPEAGTNPNIHYIRNFHGKV